MADTDCSRCGWRGRLVLRSLAMAVLMLAATRAASAGSAGCDVPTIGPVDVVAGAADNGKHLHIITGTVAVCDVAAARAFQVALPDLHDVGPVRVQLMLAGFVRRYGVHQIGFALASAEATFSPQDVTVRYVATVDGLDHYQLAYTLYLAASP